MCCLTCLILYSSELTLGDVKLEGVQSSEVIVTPTEAAAAGDINVILDKGDNNMGNNTSAPVVATSIKTVENGSTEKPYSYGDTAVVKKGNSGFMLTF
jgi:hypothetical protein